jgi:hypothetical protein
MGAAGAVIGGIVFLIWLAVLLVLIISTWKLFTKAGQPGWASIIPTYNIIVLLQIVGKPAWWIVLLFIPFVNFIIGILLCISLAKSFGKEAGFGIGLAFLGIIFFPILAFGDSKYVGPQAA